MIAKVFTLNKWIVVYHKYLICVSFYCVDITFVFKAEIYLEGKVHTYETHINTCIFSKRRNLKAVDAIAG